MAYRGCGDVEEISNVDAQPEDFKTWAKFFGWVIVMAALKTKTPSQWRKTYGDRHPRTSKDLQFVC